MKVAFIVWTPLHLYNVLRYILSNDLVGQTDLYYISQSKGMEYYLDNFKKEKIFKTVFSTSSRLLENNRVLWERIGVIISPKLYVKHLFGKKSCSKEYDKLFMSVQTKLNDSIFRANKCNEVIGFDDGTGSYISDLYDIPQWKKYNCIKKIKGAPFIDVKEVFLFAPEYRLCEDDSISFRKLEARPLTAEEKLLIRRIFGQNTNSNLPECIYLNQPFFESPDYLGHKEREIEIIKLLRRIKNDDWIVRLHPREKETDIYYGLFDDNEKNIWEIICEDEITDKHILISSFSTAQFTPKMYFDKEPSLVFTYKLYNDYTENQIALYQQLISKLKSKYNNQNRIKEPKTIDELITCIAQ